ncbi:hypothetical protein CR513_50472, partial [Mucuna pruriens]
MLGKSSHRMGDLLSLSDWEDWISHVVFAYNRAWLDMEMKGEQYAKTAYKGRKEVLFKEGDLVPNSYVASIRAPNATSIEAPNFRSNSLQEREYVAYSESHCLEDEVKEVTIAPEGSITRGRLKKINVEVCQRLALLCGQEGITKGDGCILIQGMRQPSRGNLLKNCPKLPSALHTIFLDRHSFKGLTRSFEGVFRLFSSPLDAPFGGIVEHKLQIVERRAKQPPLGAYAKDLVGPFRNYPHHYGIASIVASKGPQAWSKALRLGPRPSGLVQGPQAWSKAFLIFQFVTSIIPSLLWMTIWAVLSISNLLLFQASFGHRSLEVAPFSAIFCLYTFPIRPCSLDIEPLTTLMHKS